MLLTAIANGCFYGGGFKAAPRASMQDGLLDLCVVKKISRAKFVNLIGAYKKGTHLDMPQLEHIIRYYKTPSVCISFEKPINICVDGEIEMTDLVEIASVPSACSFSVPQGSLLLESTPKTEEAPALS